MSDNKQYIEVTEITVTELETLLDMLIACSERRGELRAAYKEGHPVLEKEMEEADKTLENCKKMIYGIVSQYLPEKWYNTVEDIQKRKGRGILNE